MAGQNKISVAVRNMGFTLKDNRSWVYVSGESLNPVDGLEFPIPDNLDSMRQCDA